jgi:outer membrane biosynthesis protein TonB
VTEERVLGPSAKGLLAISLGSLALGTVGLAMIPAPPAEVALQVADEPVLPLANSTRPTSRPSRLPEQRYVTPAPEDRFLTRRQTEIATQTLEPVADADAPKGQASEAKPADEAKPKAESKPKEAARRAPKRERPDREISASRRYDAPGYAGYGYDRWSQGRWGQDRWSAYPFGLRGY